MVKLEPFSKAQVILITRLQCAIYVSVLLAVGNCEFVDGRDFFQLRVVAVEQVNPEVKLTPFIKQGVNNLLVCVSVARDNNYTSSMYAVPRRSMPTVSLLSS